MIFFYMCVLAFSSLKKTNPYASCLYLSVGKILRVSKLSKAIISCPAVEANNSELKYLLLFNGSCIGQIHLNKVGRNVCVC